MAEAADAEDTLTFQAIYGTLQISSSTDESAFYGAGLCHQKGLCVRGLSRSYIAQIV